MYLPLQTRRIEAGQPPQGILLRDKNVERGAVPLRRRAHGQLVRRVREERESVE